MRLTLGIAWLLLGITAHSASAKCASLSVTVEGSIDAPSVGIAVRIDLYPVARGWRPAVVSPDAEGKFSATVWFDTFNGGGLFGSGLFGHDCSRRPQAMLLTLLVGDEAIGKARLEIPAQFELDRLGNYRVKRGVTLRRDG